MTADSLDAVPLAADVSKRTKSQRLSTRSSVTPAVWTLFNNAGFNRPMQV